VFLVGRHGLDLCNNLINFMLLRSGTLPAQSLVGRRALGSPSASRRRVRTTKDEGEATTMVKTHAFASAVAGALMTIAAHAVSDAAPQEQEVQASREREEEVQAPRGQEVQSPRDQERQAPRGQDRQAL